MKYFRFFIYITFYIAVFLTKQTNAQTCSADNNINYQNAIALVGERLEELYFEARENPKLQTMPFDSKSVSNSIFSGCGEKLSSAEKLRLLKDEYTSGSELSTPRSPESPNYLRRLIESSGTQGREFLTAADILFNKSSDRELILKTLNNRSGEDAQLLAAGYFSTKAWGAIKRKDTDELEFLRHIVNTHINDLGLYVETLTKGSRFLKDPKFSMDLLDRMKSIENLAITSKNTCQLVNAYSSLALSAERQLKKMEYPDPAQIKLLAILHGKFSNSKPKNMDCSDGLSVDGMLEEARGIYTKVGSSLGISMTDAAVLNLQNAAKLPRGECEVSEIKKWILSEVGTVYKAKDYTFTKQGVPVYKDKPRISYFGGGTYKNCLFNVSIIPSSKNLKSTNQKESKKISWAKVKIEFQKPALPALNFETADEYLEVEIYRQMLEAGILDKNEPQRKTIIPAQPSVPITR